MLTNYIKIALKVLKRHKLFSFISMFGISFTLLILVVIASFIDHAIGPNPPERKQRRILSSTYYKLTTPTGGTMAGPVVSYYFLDKYVKSLETPETISINSFHRNVNVYHEKRKFNFALKHTDAEFWQIMDFQFIEGKPYTPQDVEQRNPLIVISQATRDRYFGQVGVIGKSIQLDGRDYRVTGVVENVSLLRILPYADVWIPITLSKTDIHKPEIFGESLAGYFALILAHQRSDFAAIKAEFQNHMQQVEFPDDRFDNIYGGAETYFETLSRLFTGGMEERNRGGLLIAVVILMLLFMLLPTMNLVNINVSRIYERASEIGIRKAFGASSKTLIGQFLIENILITLLGGAISLILAMIVISILNGSHMIPHLHLQLNWRIFLASLIIMLIFGLFSGVLPAYRMSRLLPAETLRGGDQ